MMIVFINSFIFTTDDESDVRLPLDGTFSGSVILVVIGIFDKIVEFRRIFVIPPSQIIHIAAVDPHILT